MSFTYHCPQYNAELENKAGVFWLGISGRIAFPSFVLPKYGKIAITDFPEYIRSGINRQRLIFEVLSFFVFILAFYLLFFVD